MGIIEAFSDAVSSTLADQWRESLTAGVFDEHMVVVPGVHRGDSRGQGANSFEAEGVITNGSKVFVPENTAAFIFCQSSIEDVMTEPGEYEYYDGQDSIFNGDGFRSAIVDQIKDRVKYGGVAYARKQVAFVNLREIRGIKFGTRGPQLYNDKFYGTDLEVYAYGTFSVQVCDAVTFVKRFLPPGVYRYSLDDQRARSQIIAEFMQSFFVALNSLSEEYRVSQLPSRSNEISQAVINDEGNAGTWPERFGLAVRSVAIENIELSSSSSALVQDYSSAKMSVAAYEGVSQQASNKAAQQRIAQGVQDSGLGDGGGLLLGMNMAQGIGSNGEMKAAAASIDGQIETLKKLKELFDDGILSQEEFDAKKREVMGF